jgi:hypothetical protein
LVAWNNTKQQATFFTNAPAFDWGATVGYPRSWKNVMIRKLYFTIVIYFYIEASKTT